MFPAMVIAFIGPVSLALALNAKPAAPPPRREVEIVGMDYAFKAPAELPPGRTTFRFMNHGKVRHELNILRLAPGVSVQVFIAATISDTTPPSTISRMIDANIGVLFAEPGKRGPGELSTELIPGRTYAIRCVLQDSAKAPRHVTLGMYAPIRVRESKLADSPAPRADTVVAADYAFIRYPQTLTPRTHEFAFVNDGKHQHEMILVLLRSGETVEQLLDVAKHGGNRDAVVEDVFGLLLSRAGRNSDGLLRATLLPGRQYVIVCTLSDSVKAPPHIALGMIGSIRVTGTAAQR